MDQHRAGRRGVARRPAKLTATDMARERRPAPTLALEKELLVAGARRVAGVDEVGRGALAGPVAVGVVVVDAVTIGSPEGLADSKVLSAIRRERLEPAIVRWCAAHAVGWAEPGEIDEVGIVAALGLAGARAVASLAQRPDAVILDGNLDWLTPALGAGGPDVHLVVGGDATCASVSAASVLAKVARDRLMIDLASRHRDYRWEANKGYGSAAHRAAIARCGPTAHHRLSWRLGPAAD